MKKRLLTISILFCAVIGFYPNISDANKITYINGFEATSNSIDQVSVNLFNENLGDLYQVDVTIQSIISGFYYNLKYPNATTPLINIQDRYTPITCFPFSYQSDSQLSFYSYTSNYMETFDPWVINLNFSVYPHSESLDSVPSSFTVTPELGPYTGVYVKPIIKADLNQFIDNTIGIPDYMFFETYFGGEENTNNANVPVFGYNHQFIQFDYYYTPPTGTGELDLYQIDPYIQTMFTDITSLNQVSNEQLFALARTTIPEPSTLMLFFLGCFLLFGVRRIFKQP